MTTNYDILPDPQRRLLPALRPIVGEGFTLYGGTAIALRLGHRQSIDFDFFSEKEMDRRALTRSLPILLEATTIQDEPDTWTVLTRSDGDDRSVKLSFFSRLDFGRVGDPVLSEGGEVLLASLDDLLGHKLKVLLQRVEAKDYQDIAALLRSGMSLELGIGAALSLFPRFPAAEALRTLVYFKEGNLRALSDDDMRTLVDHADRFTTPAIVNRKSASLGR